MRPPIQRNIIAVSEEQYEIATLERILNRLYKCRDLEITNLWQRSVFLTVFLTLTLTGYGVLISTLFSTDTTVIVDEFGKKILFYKSIHEFYIHIGATLLGIVGFTFAVIWVLMAKGSKAWYEIYENAVCQFENDYGKLHIPDIFIMGYMDSLDKKMRLYKDGGYVNKRLCHIGAGGFSVSKLNILIGWVFLIIWSIIIIVHTSVLLYQVVNESGYLTSLSNNKTILGILTVGFGCLLLFIITCIVNPLLKRLANSSYFEIDSIRERFENRKNFENANK